MQKVLLAGFLGVILGIIICGAAAITMTPTATSITANAIAEPAVGNGVWSSQLNDAFKSDVPVVDSAECEANPYTAYKDKYTHFCSLFYKTPIELRKIDTTGSMWPNLKGGGYVIVTAPEDLKVDDIVIISASVYEREVVHRIIETGEDTEGVWYRTQGDNNSVPDGKVLRWSDISYKVVGVIY